MTRDRPSRRSVLAACGAGLAALAGCAEMDLPLGGDESREYQPAALARLTDEPVPVRPDAFPVAVPEGMVGRHYDRARELVAAVPERPGVPNGAVAEELRERREQVVEDLEDDEHTEATEETEREHQEGREDAPSGPGRLEEARDVRGRAAEVHGAYRAAVGEVDPASVEERRGALRTDLREFEAGWDYRGGDPARALVVHAELERLRGTARRNAAAWPPFPADPRDDVFRVGEVLGNVETGRAALADAARLRRRYMEGTPDPRSHRSAVTAASHRLDRRTVWRRRRVHEFVDRRASGAFERSVEGTPAGHLYHEARQRVRGTAEAAEAARRAGEHATAALRAATELASLRAFGAVIDAVEAGEYGPPGDAERVASARSGAVAALREAWETEPAAVSVEVAGPAHEALRGGYYRIETTDGDARAVEDAFAMFAYAERYAGTVPGVVSTVTDALERDR